MKNRIKVTRTVELSLTADDWELYDMLGRDIAAQGLNEEVAVALNKGDMRAAEKALCKFSKWGAADSEGFHTLERIQEYMVGK